MAIGEDQDATAAVGGRVGTFFLIIGLSGLGGLGSGGRALGWVRDELPVRLDNIRVLQVTNVNLRMFGLRSESGTQ